MPRFKNWRCSQPGPVHDEALRCFGCERPVCGLCARVEAGEWLCPDCPPDTDPEIRATEQRQKKGGPDA